MKYPSIIKGAVLSLLLASTAIAVKAQKIEEQDLKININKIADPAAHLQNLQPVAFQYNTAQFKHLKFPAGTQYGFLASNVKKEFPELVYETSQMYTSGKNNTKTAKYQKVETESLIPVLVAAIKEQQAQIEQLKKEVEQLKNR
nr:tail fiber domain-containing protein [Pedobacter sp. ASV19]